MDVWSVINPLLRVAIYLTTFGVVGTILFNLHFRKYLSVDGLAYCHRLIKRSSIVGFLVAAASFLSIAGNMGGNFLSAFDTFMLQLTLESKAGIAALTSVLGFFFALAWGSTITRWRVSATILGAYVILLSFVMLGHSSREGLVTQILLIVHLIGIAFWLGSLLPFRHICQSAEKYNLHIIAHRFGLFALGYVGALVLAGLVFSFILLGGLLPLISTAYGNVLLAKLVVVSLLLTLGALNKFRLVPLLLEDEELGAKRLRSSVQFEIVLAFIVLFLTSLLTTSLILPMVHK
jgi:putative copper resistance protein D